MKKFLLSLTLLLPISVMAANFEVIEPVWEDFAPKAFADVKQPKGLLGKMNVTATYWYQRRMLFEKGLDNCRAFEDSEDKYSCFEKLKVEQYKENSEYNAKLEAQQNMYSGIPEMNNSVDTMLPLNNYLNTFTKFQENEIR